MRGALAIARFTISESVRRRVFYVVLAITLVYLLLYALGLNFVFEEVRAADPDEHSLASSITFGLAMFGNLFLGSVLAVFLTNGMVRGDAETGMLQPLVVRPVGRHTMLITRFAAAAGVSAVYVMINFAVAVLVTEAITGSLPDNLLEAMATLSLGVVVVAAISTLASVFLAATAQGIAVFMTFGAGLFAGLLGQIATGVGSQGLENVAEAMSWALPFEALYQHGLHVISQDSGFGMQMFTLGPFGGANQASTTIWPWTIGYVVVIVGLASLTSSRRDL